MQPPHGRCFALKASIKLANSLLPTETGWMGDDLVDAALFSEAGW